MAYSLDELKKKFGFGEKDLDLSEFTFDSLTILTEKEMKALYESGAKTTKEIRDGNARPAK